MNGKLLGTIGLCTLLAAGARAQEPGTLEARMSGAEFRASGLHKLSREELAYLNDWLEAESPSGPASAGADPAPAAPAQVSDEQMGLRSRGQPDDRVVIESTLAGDFTGWRGRTRFELANGQLWEQVGGGSYYARMASPAVRIEPKALGSWKLYVDGIGRGVRVRRIR